MKQIAWFNHLKTNIHIAKNEIKWAYQRLFSGWDDTVIDGIDYYLDYKFPEWIDTLIKSNPSVPSSFFDNTDFDEEGGLPDKSFIKAQKRYFIILNQISDGFKAHKEIIENNYYLGLEEYNDRMKKFENSLDLLKIYYQDLRD
jgi:hypothetical protein